MVQTSSHRINKYGRKIDGKVIGKKYNAAKDTAVEKQRAYFAAAEKLEIQVKKLCSDIPSIQIHFYIAFAEEIIKKTTDNERDIVFNKWRSRGLLHDKLNTISEALIGFTGPPVPPAEWDYTGNNYDLSPAAGVRGMFWDGANWWIIIAGATVFKYDANWNYLGVSHDLRGQDNRGADIFWDGTNWWMLGDQNDRVYKYDVNWNYLGVSFPVGAQDIYPSGIFWDGTNWWMCGYQNDRVYKYDVNWNYLGVSFPVGTEEGAPTGIFWDGINWWMCGNATDSVYKYDANWNYLGVSHDLHLQDGFVTDIFKANGKWWMLGANTNYAYEYVG